MFPKVNNSAEVIKLDKLVSEYETSYKRKKKIGFEVIIETTLGLINVESMCKSVDFPEPLRPIIAALCDSERFIVTSLNSKLSKL